MQSVVRSILSEERRIAALGDRSHREESVDP